MKRRIIVILSIVLVLGMVGGGIWVYVRRNSGPKL